MGKGEINVTDPAYDLANTILTLELSPDEEARLVRRYAAAGDTSVEQRLFMNKLLAGLWAMQSAQEYLFGKTQQSRVQREYHDQFLAAWNFLTVHVARFCGHVLPPDGRTRMAQPPRRAGCRWRDRPTNPWLSLHDGGGNRRAFPAAPTRHFGRAEHGPLGA